MKSEETSKNAKEHKSIVIVKNEDKRKINKCIHRLIGSGKFLYQSCSLANESQYFKLIGI